MWKALLDDVSFDLRDQVAAHELPNFSLKVAKKIWRNA